MVAARNGIRNIYADAVEAQSLKWTLDEMLARGLPKDVYDKYLDEAERLGLIPIAGKSVIGGKVIQQSDILKKSDVLKPIPKGFNANLSFYGIG